MIQEVIGNMYRLILIKYFNLRSSLSIKKIPDSDSFGWQNSAQIVSINLRENRGEVNTS